MPDYFHRFRRLGLPAMVPIALFFLGGCQTGVPATPEGDPPAVPAADAAPTSGHDPAFENHDDALPQGAKVRLGTAHSVPVGFKYLVSPPDGKNSLLLDHLVGDIPYLWDLSAEKFVPLPRVQREGAGRSSHGEGCVFAVSGDGSRGVIGQNKHYAVWELKTGRVADMIKLKFDLVDNRHSIVSLSRDGKILAFMDDADGPGNPRRREVVVWDVDGHKLLARLAVFQHFLVFPVLSPDGKALVTFGFGFQGDRAEVPAGVDPDQALQVWEATSGKLRVTIPGAFPGRGHSASFSPDGKTVATGDSLGTVRFWSAATGEAKGSVTGGSRQGWRVGFSPDGKTLAGVAIDGTVERWSFPEGRPMSVIGLPRPDLAGTTYHRIDVERIGFAGNDRVLVWGKFGTRTVAWEVPSGKLLTPVGEHSAEIRRVQFSAGGREVLTIAANDRTVRWDAATGKSLGSVTPPIQFVAPAGDRGLRYGTMFDLKTGKELFQVPVYSVAVSADFKYAAGFRASPDGKTLPTVCEVWNLDTRQKIAGLDLPPDVVNLSGACLPVAAFSPDGTRLVTAVRLFRSREGGLPLQVTGFDIKTGKKLGEFTEPGGMGWIAIAVADNSACVVATQEGQLWAADYETGRKGEVIERLPVRAGQVTTPVFSPDGRRLAWVARQGNDGVRVYDWPRGRPIHTFAGHVGPVTALAFTPDGKYLASGSGDCTVLLWDLANLPK